MSKIETFRDLIAWQKAMTLAECVYDVTEGFPPRERFGLAFQMRKSAVSIPSNIAEGHRRRTATYVYHLEVALGSHGELDTQCELATRRNLIAVTDRKALSKLLEDVGALTYRLMRSVDNGKANA